MFGKRTTRLEKEIAFHAKHLSEMEKYFFDRLKNHNEADEAKWAYLSGRLRKLEGQIRDLARLCDCTITPHKEEDPGGVVRKLTEKEKEDRNQWNNIYSAVYGNSISDMLRGGTGVSRVPTQMPKKKQKSVKKKK